MTADTRTIPAAHTVNSLNSNVVLSAPSVPPPSGWQGFMRSIICVATNTAACYLNDGTSTASGSNTFWSIGSGGMAVGARTILDWPLYAGLSFVPGGGTFSLSWD